MKIKILDKFSYQTQPITNDMIEVDDNILKEIGKTKCFENGKVIDYDNSNVLEKQAKQERIYQIKERLSKITEDLAQVQCGVIVPNIEEEKLEFQNLLNEIRELEGKEPREIEKLD